MDSQFNLVLYPAPDTPIRRVVQDLEEAWGPNELGCEVIVGHVAPKVLWFFGIDWLPALELADEVFLQGKQPTKADLQEILQGELPESALTEPGNLDWRRWPTSVDAAACFIAEHLPAEEREAILAFPPDPDKIDPHGRWATAIGDTFGLWRGNRALLESCGTDYGDVASEIIICAIHERLTTMDSTLRAASRAA